LWVFVGLGLRSHPLAEGYVGGAAKVKRGQAASDGASGRHGDGVPTRGMGGRIGLGMGRDGITIPSVGKGWVGGAADLERGQVALDGASGRHGNVVPTH